MDNLSLHSQTVNSLFLQGAFFMTELLFNEQKLPLLFETSETKEQCTMVKAWMSVATWPAVHFEQHR
jgi:hypothetical protein